MKLAKSLNGLDSVTASGTVINAGGLTVGGRNYVTPTGINANNQKLLVLLLVHHIVMRLITVNYKMLSTALLRHLL